MATDDLNALMSNQIYEENFIKRDSTIHISQILKGLYNPYKILANFILDPVITVLIIFLISQENRLIIFSDKIFEGAVSAVPKSEEEYSLYDNINNKENKLTGKTLIYLISPCN
jgi:hypothetical protein